MKLLDKDGLTYYTGKIKNELTDYVKNTDYATDSKGGVVKIGAGLTVNASGNTITNEYSYSSYETLPNYVFIGKGTLENVLTERIGSIDTILETLTVGGGV